MEKRVIYKISQLESGLNNFEESLGIDTSEFSPILIDSVKSGRVQKFEFCTELLWKTLKVYLYEVNGIDCKSPKQTIKEFYNTGYISSEEYEDLIELLDDRNQLNHVYNSDQFNVIYNRVVNSLSLFKRVLKEIKKGC